ncbi:MULTISPECIES: MFS transporter [unclassified Caballeronia]|uniref:MFS transporter n=1 Tax=unclassified Caballeronia TaxID=2646786 RepID=UPI0020299A14|nr:MULTISPECIES: MFS transporter [unclassified Caballeronia]
MSQLNEPAALSGGAMVQEESAAYRKVIGRLMPFLLIAFMINAIDRVNISFAKLGMAHDIGLSDAAYGLSAAVFYLGYVLFEVPANLYLQRAGARATLTRIMILWGAVTMLTAFVKSPNQLIAMRFLLGVAEAGFLSGMILYLSYWFPSALRGRITAAFLMSGVVAGILSGPFAGWIMTHVGHDAWLRDWQALFVVEGMPAVVMGVVAWFWLTDRPARAQWLTDAQKQVIAAALAAEHQQAAGHASFAQVLRNPIVYVMGLVYFCIYGGSNTVSYWMPTLIRSMGIDNLSTIGALASLPYVVALAGMYLLGRSSDRRQERRWHLALTMCAGAGCFIALGFARGHLALSIALMSVGCAAALSAISLFWTIPPALLKPGGAAGGIAMISSIGTTAGIVSPAAVGAIQSATGSLYVAFDVMAFGLIGGALVLLVALRRASAPATLAVAPTGSQRESA